MNRNQRIGLLLGISIIAIVASLWIPPIPQDPLYHNLSDRRIIAGIPNFGDVVSNLVFLLVGVWGLWQLKGIREDRSRLILKREMIPFAVAFAGAILIFPGSAYYHWEPSNATLLWDRLPMTLVFMSIFSMVIMERISVKTGLSVLIPLLAVGVASVVYWHRSEGLGQGDLRPYALVQFLPVVLIPAMLALFPARYSGSRYILEMLVWYGVAKGLEYLDAPIWQWTGEWVGGHALKHLAAAWAIFALVRYLKHRQYREPESSETAG